MSKTLKEMENQVEPQDKKLTEQQKQFIEIYEANGTNVAASCKKIGIDRSTHYRWYNTNDTYKKAIDDSFEGILDFAESMMLKNIKAGKEASIFFFLKTRAKQRGYIERQEVETKDVIDWV